MIFYWDTLSFETGMQADVSYYGIRDTYQADQLFELVQVFKMGGLQVEAALFNVLKEALNAASFFIHLAEQLCFDCTKEVQQFTVRSVLMYTLPYTPSTLQLLIRSTFRPLSNDSALCVCSSIPQ